MLMTDNLRILSSRGLIPPVIMTEELPLTDQAAKTVAETRKAIGEILQGRDDRLLVLVGPCSIHDMDAAIEYGQKLKALSDTLKQDLLIVMRVYFEKPRTTVGWKGFINDPNLDGSFQINKGLRLARELLLKLSDMGLPCGSEFLDVISPQYISDLVSWGAIGARTTESQVHRELASGLSVPIGFKNGTDGSIQVAVDAVRAASVPHHFLGITKQGHTAIFATKGNEDTHIILRGGKDKTNYDETSVQQAVEVLKSFNLHPRVMIDCSHGNSEKDYLRQPKVAEAVREQLKAGSFGIMGVMIESHLKAGNQSIDTKPLNYGQSITDACISWEMTIPLLESLAESVRLRRRSR